MKTRMLAVLVLVASLHTDSINLVAGDASASRGYVAGATEQDRIRGHLLYAYDTLAAVDPRALSPQLRAARAKNLERLLAYAHAGQFPRNDDHPDARRPTFVDDNGEICAVGALYASDRGYPAAARIARDFKYAFIAEIHDPDLHAWQRTSGLTPDELALIQPTYGPAPLRLHVPWGLTDRMQLGPSRVALATEVSTTDSFDTMTTTLYGHARMPGRYEPFGASAYLALPLGFVVHDRDDPTSLAAGGELVRDRASHWYGNGDVGIFVGRDDDEGTASLVRFGALLPTGSGDADAPRTGIRAGDFVQDLPRSYGGRISTSRMVGWRGDRSRTHYAVRFDAGLDYARAVAGEHAQYFVPRAALGLLVRKRFAAISFDSSVAHVFDEDASGSLRWSGGTTVRLATPCGFQPALTFAATRTPEGWGGAFALELAAALGG